MQALKYSTIKTSSQYDYYCRVLEELLDSAQIKYLNDEIDLLTLLIKKWVEDHNTFEESNPIELLQYLMTENNLKAKDLADILQVSEGLVSDVLNYKKGLSKEIIRALSARLKVSHQAFIRPQKLKVVDKIKR